MNFTFRWAVATLLGITIGMGFAILLDRPLGHIFGPMITTPIVTGVAGMILGASQALQLRARLARPLAWIAASTLGYGAGLAVGVVVIEYTGRALIGHRPHLFQLTLLGRAGSLAVLGLVAGAILGAAQSLVFRGQSTKVPGWAGRVAIALAAGFSVSSIVIDLLAGGLSSPVGVVAFVVLAGTLFGALSGSPLSRLSQRAKVLEA